MKTAETIQNDINIRFTEKTNKSIHAGSVIDLYNCSISDTLEDVYEEIENSKNPHIFTKLTGKDLDDTGFWVNLPRKVGESDESYFYRLKNWALTNETSNLTAITNALLLPQYSSNIEFIPKTKGSGTGTCYVLPKDYKQETITNALIEAEQIMKSIATPTCFIEYIVPEAIKTTFNIFIEFVGDENLIKNNLITQIFEYVNNIPPKEYLEIGAINKIGINEPGVKYFSVLATYLNDIENKDIKILQGLSSKMLFDKIVWYGGNQ